MKNGRTRVLEIYWACLTSILIPYPNVSDPTDLIVAEGYLGLSSQVIRVHPRYHIHLGLLRGEEEGRELIVLFRSRCKFLLITCCAVSVLR